MGTKNHRVKKNPSVPKQIGKIRTRNPRFWGNQKPPHLTFFTHISILLYHFILHSPSVKKYSGTRYEKLHISFSNLFFLVTVKNMENG